MGRNVLGFENERVRIVADVITFSPLFLKSGALTLDHDFISRISREVYLSHNNVDWISAFHANSDTVIGESLPAV